MTTIKPVANTAPERQCVLRAIERRGLASAAALLLAVSACYGTLAAVAVLSAIGITLAVSPGVWAGAIVLFAALASAIVGLGIRRHRSAAPLFPALAGTTLLAYVMFGRFDRLLELAAFALLAAAVHWDYRLRAGANR